MVAGEGTDSDDVADRFDVGEVGNAIDVDDDRRAHQTEVEHRHQTLPTCRMALEPAPSRFSSMVISPATPGKFLSPARQPRILSRSASRSLGLLVTPDVSMQCL